MHRLCRYRRHAMHANGSTRTTHVHAYCRSVGMQCVLSMPGQCRCAICHLRSCMHWAFAALSAWLVLFVRNGVVLDGRLAVLGQHQIPPFSCPCTAVRIYLNVSLLHSTPPPPFPRTTLAHYLMPFLFTALAVAHSFGSDGPSLRLAIRSIKWDASPAHSYL